MAWTASLITSMISDANATPVSAWTTQGAFTPTANAILFAWTSNGTRTTSPQIGPTVAGFGSVWTSLASSDLSGNLAIYRHADLLWTRVGANPSSDSVRFSYTTNQRFTSWQIVELNGASSAPIVQSVSSALASGSTLTIIGSAFGSAANAAMAFFIQTAQGVVVFPPAMVALSQNSSTPNHTMASQWTSGATTLPWFGTNASASSLFGVEVEVQLAVVTGTGFPLRQRFWES